LIVDDHALFAQALATTIGLLDGYAVAGVAITGPEALRLCAEEQPDVILLDYHLPGYLAEDLLPQLKAAAPHTRVIIVTSDTSSASRERGLGAGAIGFVTKDRAIDDVVDALKTATRAPEPPGDDGQGLLVRIPGIASFAGLVTTERQLELLAPVAGVYASELTDAGATYRIDLRPGSCAQDLVAAATEDGLRLEPVG